MFKVLVIYEILGGAYKLWATAKETLSYRRDVFHQKIKEILVGFVVGSIYATLRKVSSLTLQIRLLE